MSKNGTEKDRQRERKILKILKQFDSDLSPSLSVSYQCSGELIICSACEKLQVSRWSALPWGCYNDEVCISHVTGTLIPYVSELSNDYQCSSQPSKSCPYLSACLGSYCFFGCFQIKQQLFQCVCVFHIDYANSDV